MKTNTYFEDDIISMLDSLCELFQERGDKVTATLIAARMEQKLHRHIHHHRAAYLYKLLDFDSRKGTGHGDSKAYIVHNPKLLAERRAQFCKVDVTASDKSGVFEMKEPRHQQ